MLQDVQEETENCCKQWLVTNIFVEIPIIGSYFKMKTFTSALHDAGKCVAALVGGSTAMMTILIPTETDQMSIQITKMTVSMAIGMTAGKITYNGICTSGSILYQYLSSNSHANYRAANADIEMQPITTCNLPGGLGGPAPISI